MKKNLNNPFIFIRTMKEITLGNKKFLAIDLTEPLREDIEVYPGDPKPSKEVFSDIEKTGCQYHIYKLGDHIFHPHGDAPSHQNKNSEGFETFNIEYCFNPAFLIDLSCSEDAEEIDGIKYLKKIEKKHIEKYSELLSSKKAVLIRTGYDRWTESNKPHSPDNLPFITKDAADFISGFKNIKVLGIDSLTVDPHGEHYVHKKFKDLMIVESMVHLYDITNKEFDLQTTPLRIIGATGGPVVAYAFIEV